MPRIPVPPLSHQQPYAALQDPLTAPSTKHQAPIGTENCELIHTEFCMPSPLPEFASQWVKQWKEAAPRLQAIRDEELRRREELHQGVLRGGADKPLIWERYPERHGMVIMQQWFMRGHLLAMNKLLAEDRDGR
jgi:hypothetical protein